MLGAIQDSQLVMHEAVGPFPCWETPELLTDNLATFVEAPPT